MREIHASIPAGKISKIWWRELQKPTSDETYKLRAQIAARLKVLVETLLIAPQASGPRR